MAQAPHLATGYVARAHGLDGEVGIKTFDPASETLFEVERVFLKLRDGSELELQIDSIRTSNKDVLVMFEGIDRRTKAEPLVGSTVHVFREDLDPPTEGEYFLGDLVGLKAVDEQDAELGVVEEVMDAGPVPNLVIRKGTEELMVPFADEFVPKVDIEGGKVTVKPPEYLE